MAKHDDILAERATQRLVELNPDRNGMTTAADMLADDTPDVPRLRKVPAAVDADGLDLIARAMQLQRALLGDVGSSSQESRGKALVAICQSWLLTESARLSGKGGA